MSKKTVKFLCELSLMAVLMLIVIQWPIALAASSIPLPSGSNYSTLPTPDTGMEGKAIAVAGVTKAIGYLKVLIGVIAIGFITFSGAKLVMSNGDEEAITKGRKGLLYSIIAFAIIAMAEEMGQIVGFVGVNGAENGGILKSPQAILERVHLFDNTVEILITFIKYLIGSLAVLMIVVNGVKLVTGGGEEENVKKAKNGIAYSLAGLILLIFSSTFINNVFYKIDKTAYTGLQGADPQTDVARGVSELVGITNFIVSFVGPILVLLIIVGGIMYLTSGGQEESMNKAKRLLIAALIGVVVIYGAFAIVSTIVSGSFSATQPIT